MSLRYFDHKFDVYHLFTVHEDDVACTKDN